MICSPLHIFYIVSEKKNSAWDNIMVVLDNFSKFGEIYYVEINDNLIRQLRSLSVAYNVSRSIQLYGVSTPVQCILFFQCHKSNDSTKPVYGYKIRGNAEVFFLKQLSLYPYFNKIKILEMKLHKNSQTLWMYLSFKIRKYNAPLCVCSQEC